ncbi:hypothetical protein [Fodinicola acaciae]|uniref:hypothetical protein n=1 Tax=Fodinicola acaciae TaxID=2681555 RepID=UPI0013D66939|nr:hypothetical protein [Fodinicola acaciae]
MDRFDGLVTGYDQLTAGQLEAIAAVNDRYGGGAKEYVELAAQHADEWYDQLQMLLANQQL